MNGIVRQNGMIDMSMNNGHGNAYETVNIMIRSNKVRAFRDIAFIRYALG